MKNNLLQLSDFNIWANNRFIEVLTELSKEQINQEMISSFPTIKSTVKHLYGAELAWYNRLFDPEYIYDFKKDYEGSFEELLSDWRDISKKWKEYIKNHDETTFDSVFKYKRLDSSLESVIKDAIIHLFNHATYHRGQLVTMLRQVGSSKIPSTDYILYTRSRN